MKSKRLLAIVKSLKKMEHVKYYVNHSMYDVFERLKLGSSAELHLKNHFIYHAYNSIMFHFSECFLGSIEQVFGFSHGPGGFRELRGASRNHRSLVFYVTHGPRSVHWGGGQLRQKRRIRKFSTKKVSPLFSRVSLVVPYIFL